MRQIPLIIGVSRRFLSIKELRTRNEHLASSFKPLASTSREQKTATSIVRSMGVILRTADSGSQSCATCVGGDSGLGQGELTSLPDLRSETSTPRTRTCSWGPRTWGTQIGGLRSRHGPPATKSSWGGFWPRSRFGSLGVGLLSSATQRRAPMTATRMLGISFALLIFATCGLASILFLAMKYFTYQGTGLDWIYPTAGLLIMLWCLSAFGVVASGVTVLLSVVRRKLVRR